MSQWIRATGLRPPPTRVPPPRRRACTGRPRGPIYTDPTCDRPPGCAAGLRRGAGGATLVRMPSAHAQLGRRAAASLHLVLAAIPSGGPHVRCRLRVWPAGLGWPTPVAGDLEYVVHEAVTNLVVHTYPRLDRADPGTPRAGGEADAAPPADRADSRRGAAARRAAAAGPSPGPRRGRPPPLNPGCRGHGLITMAAMTDQMSIKPATPGLAGHPFHLAAGGIPVNHPTFPRGGTTHPGRKRRDDRHGRRIGRSQ